MENKKLIAFDLYDTCIHHPKNLTSYRKIFEDWNIPKETINELREILQKKPINIENANFDIPANLIKDINELTEKNIQWTILYPETIDTLEYLKSKWYKIAVVSNLAQKYEKPLRDLFPQWIFDYEALSFKVWELKPNPWIFEYLRDISWIDLKDMAMIWDKENIDIQWAQNVWIDWIQIDRTMKWWTIRYEKDFIKISTLSALKKLFK
jgi:FMN phosphatase YigB (HAD superfamily)